MNDYDSMPFELFDPKAEFVVRCGALPHWYQPGATYFVTFRSADSVPQELSRKWRVRREGWLKRRGIDPHASDWKLRLRSEPEIEQAFHAEFVPEFMSWLDHGYGECAFKNPSNAEIVADSLRSGDGERYSLGDFVIMPNHVHVIVGLIGATDIQRQCFSWKTFTAKRINRLLNRRGRFWQAESFDHLIRSPEQFDYLCNYIADTPRDAHLRNGEYLHYRRP